MMPKSTQCRTSSERIAATSIIQGIGPQNDARNLSNGLAFFSGSSLGPYLGEALPRFILAETVLRSPEPSLEVGQGKLRQVFL